VPGLSASRYNWAATCLTDSDRPSKLMTPPSRTASLRGCGCESVWRGESFVWIRNLGLCEWRCFERGTRDFGDYDNGSAELGDGDVSHHGDGGNAERGELCLRHGWQHAHSEWWRGTEYCVRAAAELCSGRELSVDGTRELGVGSDVCGEWRCYGERIDAERDWAGQCDGDGPASGQWELRHGGECTPELHSAFAFWEAKKSLQTVTVTVSFRHALLVCSFR